MINRLITDGTKRGDSNEFHGEFAEMPAHGGDSDAGGLDGRCLRLGAGAGQGHARDTSDGAGT
ncbi:hypothetical protein HOK021_14340 [Streptomyces hygroscopicus]|nr:hypothetical protein HOK021_14340 [Streptomyces hygroscopicus]